MIHETENKQHLVAEASDIGFAVGVWPVSFVHNGRTFNRFNIAKDNEGDVVSVDYVAATGEYTRITVFND